MVLAQVDDVKLDDLAEGPTTREERCLYGFGFFVRTVAEFDTIGANVYLQRTQKDGFSVEGRHPFALLLCEMEGCVPQSFLCLKDRRRWRLFCEKFSGETFWDCVLKVIVKFRNVCGCPFGLLHGGFEYA